MDIKIISASVRTEKSSHRVALFFNKYVTGNNLASVEMLDLKEYKFPLFDERLQHLKDPPQNVLEFAEKVKAADGIIIVTPEYNGGYPASLKNVVDLLYPEWKKKPIAIATVSDGPFGGTQVITSILFSLWKIGAWVVPSRFHVPEVHVHYDEEGNPSDPVDVEKKAKIFVHELIWCIEAKKKMEEGI